jgi:hypothetical protein
VGVVCGWVSPAGVQMEQGHSRRGGSCRAKGPDRKALCFHGCLAGGPPAPPGRRRTRGFCLAAANWICNQPLDAAGLCFRGALSTDWSRHLKKYITCWRTYEKKVSLLSSVVTTFSAERGNLSGQWIWRLTKILYITETQTAHSFIALCWHLIPWRRILTSLCNLKLVLFAIDSAQGLTIWDYSVGSIVLGKHNASHVIPLSLVEMHISFLEYLSRRANFGICVWLRCETDMSVLCYILPSLITCSLTVGSNCCLVICYIVDWRLIPC